MKTAKLVCYIFSDRKAIEVLFIIVKIQEK